MTPPATSTPVVDTQYRDMLQRILDHGEMSQTRQGVPAITLMQQTLRFDLAHGFPVITDRDASKFWHKAIGELCAFINGARRLEDIESFGCDWWDDWVTEEKCSRHGLETGDLGPASYGGAFHDFPNLDGTSFDQFGALVKQLVEQPHIRTHFVSPWIPGGLSRAEGRVTQATIAPCHGWVHVRVLNDRLHLHLFQRSGDVPIGVPSNMIQYSALMLMLEVLTGFEAGVFYHTISDAHIYENQVEKVRVLLERETKPLGYIRLTGEGRSVTDIHDFRAEHFELSAYDPNPGLRIPVAV